MSMVPTGDRFAVRFPTSWWLDATDPREVELWRRLEQGGHAVLQLDVEGAVARVETSKTGRVTHAVRVVVDGLFEVEEFGAVVPRR